MNTVRKSIAAALSGIAAWGVTAHPDGIDGLEWWGLFGVLVGAFLVWLTPNEPATVNLNERLRGAGLWDDEHTTPDRGAVDPQAVVEAIRRYTQRNGPIDRGAVNWQTVALVVIAAVAVAWAFGWLPIEVNA